jgi:hypothetical protein
MNIVKTHRQILRLFSYGIVLLLLPQIAQAQPEQEAMGLCFTQGDKVAVVRSVIGGESHDSYVFHVVAGRKVTIRITSPANRASFNVSTSEFGEPVPFGKETDQGRTWTGTIPTTGVYFISVVAHPTARYTLRVTKE